MTSARWIRAAVVAGAVALALDGPRISATPQEPTDRATLAKLGELFAAGQHDEVVRSALELTSRRPLPIELVPALMLKAESEVRLGRRAAAVADYRSAIDVVEKATNNVTRRRYVSAYFRLGGLLNDPEQNDAAIAMVEAGLRLAPQHVEGQIQLGELFVEGGQRDRALRHFRTVLASPLPVSEERAVLGIKIDRIASGVPGASVQPIDLSAMPFHTGVSIGLVPLNGLGAEVNLADVCVVLEANWRIPCRVTSPATIAESRIQVVERNQDDAERILRELRQRFPESSRPDPYLLAVTNRDIFGPDTNFVFSWQGRGNRGGTGVLSTKRLVTEIPGYSEPVVLATRRVAVQALSTTSRMMGFTRPIDPQCPTAYPESLREFQMKQLRLCDTDEQQRDQLLARLGGPSAPFGRERSDVYARVRRAYFID
jgi:predicted Zn-dependent protease